LCRQKFEWYFVCSNNNNFFLPGITLCLCFSKRWAPGPGDITGDVTVFQKKLFGKLKKKKDMSGVFVYITGFKSETPEVKKRFVLYHNFGSFQT
jgi:hypothetical protein